MNLREDIARLVAKQNKTWVIVEAVFLVGVIGFIDYATTYEVTFFPFYSIPILLAIFFNGRAAAIGVSVLSAIAWWWADTASGHTYSRPWFHVADTMGRLMFFLLIVVAGEAVRRQRDANRAKIELLERSHRLERQIIGISEREQQRIGRDLHDGLGQHLVAIGMAADALKEEIETEYARGADPIRKIADLIHDAVLRARELSHGLSPVDRDAEGLELALQELALSSSRLTGIPCSFISDGEVKIYENDKAVHMFRIAQEAVNNAAKHASPKSIAIQMEKIDDNLVMQISDDGIGFRSENEGKGIGLNIMHYRARMIGGILNIQPNSPTGTIVTCSVPALLLLQPNPEPTLSYD